MTFPAQSPDLRRFPLVAGASRSVVRSPRSAAPRIRFLFVDSRVRFTLRSAYASRRTPCASLRSLRPGSGRTFTSKSSPMPGPPLARRPAPGSPGGGPGRLRRLFPIGAAELRCAGHGPSAGQGGPLPPLPRGCSPSHLRGGHHLPHRYEARRPRMLRVSVGWKVGFRRSIRWRRPTLGGPDPGPMCPSRITCSLRLWRAVLDAGDGGAGFPDERGGLYLLTTRSKGATPQSTTY